MNGLHLFIDNSNIFIEAQRVARQKFFYDDAMVIRLRISYGSLLNVVQNQRKLMEAVLVGSKPPANDTLWNKLQNLNIDPRIFPRNPYSNKEKGVDAELSNAIRDAIEDYPTPGIIALIAGDSDYIPTLERCIKKKWSVEVYFWEQVSSKLIALTGIQFISLDNHFEKITYTENRQD